MLRDCAHNAEQPEKMREDTRRIVFGELPSMVIDWDQEANQEIYPQFDTMYYRLGHLASAVKRLRERRGETIASDAGPQTWEAREAEWSRCVGLSRPIWRLLVGRLHPEWIDDPEQYYLPTIRFDQVYYARKRTMAYCNIGATVISDTYVHNTYQEAVSTGIKGIAGHGVDSLRELLVDEHPELDSER